MKNVHNIHQISNQYDEFQLPLVLHVLMSTIMVVIYDEQPNHEEIWFLLIFLFFWYFLKKDSFEI